MVKVELGKHQVELYASIEELPVARFHKYNKCVLVEAGIGSDLSQLDMHISRAVEFIKQGEKDDAAKELQNLRQNVLMIHEGLNPQSMAFACLVASIDGEPQNDISDDGLQRVVSMFADVPIKDITAQAEAVKKKIDAELLMYYPNIFDDARVKEYYDMLHRRTMLVLDNIINGESKERNEQIEQVTADMLTYSKPKNFVGKDSAEIVYDKQFDELCLFISQELNINAKNMSVMEFYNAYLYIEKRTNRQKRQNKPR